MNKTIWMYWATGWDTAPELVDRCRKLWVKMNPDWKVQLLTDLNLGSFINLEEHIPGFSKKNIPLAAKSDIIRALLLSTYGGVWTDATVCPTKPLNSWLKKHYSAGFFAFSDPLRKNPKELHEHDKLSASWFLMAKEGNYIMSKWAKEVVKYWGKKDSLETYFWFHYLFTDLYGSDRRFRAEWDAVEKISCNIRRREGPHLFAPYEEEVLSDPNTEKGLEESKAPMFKLSHHKKHNLMESRVIQKLFKLANQNTFDAAQQIPRIIWIYWAQGWSQAPDLVKKCRSAWERMHPDWEIRALTDKNIEEYIDIESYIPGFYKKNLSKASKSDVLRMLLMYQYGGVWVDASSLPMKPLGEWLWDHLQAEFFAFSDAFRQDAPMIYPKDRMADTWFIASRNDNYIIHAWTKIMISFLKDRDYAHNERGPGLIKHEGKFKMGAEYFWLAYLFSALYQTDDRVKRLWDAVKKIDCDTISRQGPSFFVPYSDKLLSSLTIKDLKEHDGAPVLKLTQKQPLLDYRVINDTFKLVEEKFGTFLCK